MRTRRRSITRTPNGCSTSRPPERARKAGALVSYVLDASYADTFFQELSPAWLNYARAINGVPQKPLDRPFTYLELGAGFGHSTVVNAAACPHGEFHACDLNP